jgi:hypothetical protein
MSMSNSFEHALLRLLFLNEALATLGDASGLPSPSGRCVARVCGHDGRQGGYDR